MISKHSLSNCLSAARNDPRRSHQHSEIHGNVSEQRSRVQIVFEKRELTLYGNPRCIEQVSDREATFQCRLVAGIHGGRPAEISVLDLLGAMRSIRTDSSVSTIAATSASAV